MVGYDERELTCKQGGKPAAIAHLRNLYPYETVIMVGDGITDLEAVQISGGADAFIGGLCVTPAERTAYVCWQMRSPFSDAQA